jgi:hypothetical protein
VISATYESAIGGTSRAKERADLLGGGFYMAHAATQTSQIATKSSGNAPAISSADPNREKALQILSKSIYKELRGNGYEPKQIVALATEIISLVTTDLGPLD